jgi:hypothetical protein
MQEIELTIIQDLYKTEEDEEGNEVSILVKKNVKGKFTAYTQDIKVVSQVHSEKGRVIKSKARIIHTDLGEVTVLYNYQSLVDIVFRSKPESKVGFKTK